MPTGTLKVPDELNVCVPPGVIVPPSTPIFEVPIAILIP
jgi:hypothetical protein